MEIIHSSCKTLNESAVAVEELTKRQKRIAKAKTQITL